MQHALVGYENDKLIFFLITCQALFSRENKKYNSSVVCHFKGPFLFLQFDTFRCIFILFLSQNMPAEIGLPYYSKNFDT